MRQHVFLLHSLFLRLAYPAVFGGVTLFTTQQFLASNGFSNEYFGWGGEDDDMLHRYYSYSCNYDYNVNPGNNRQPV